MAFLLLRLRGGGGDFENSVVFAQQMRNIFTILVLEVPS